MSFHLLIHQLPPRPLYLRAKVRHRLARVGAIALKNSVYLLPEREDCLEDLQWIAQEAAAGGGEAFVCRAEFLGGVSDAALVQEFRRRSHEAYEVLRTEISEALERARRRAAVQPAEERKAALARLRKRLEEVVATDFFGSPARKEAEAMMRALEREVHGRKTQTVAARSHSDLVGRTWVTRASPKIDRLASAWLIRRFVDPGARFRFVTPQSDTRRPGEIRFDMVGGDFTHEADRCTFETLLARLGLDQPALRSVAEIVHDVDLKDEKYGRPEALGVRQLIEGLVQAHPDDEERLARGLALFDDLFASFRGPAPARGVQGGRARAAARTRGGAKSRRRR
jgi:hypothetical protein